MILLLLVFSVLLAVVAAMFALQNTAAVTVSFLSYRIDGSLAVVLMMAFSLGLLAAVLALLPALLKVQWRNAALSRRLRGLEPSPPGTAGESPPESFAPPPPKEPLP